jgi:hypothetical protein
MMFVTMFPVNGVVEGTQGATSDLSRGRYNYHVVGKL